MTMQELLARKAEIEAEIAKAKLNAIMQTADEVRRLAESNGVGIPELVLSLTEDKRSRTKVAPRWRNAMTGDTWTGRGKRPKWFIEGASHIERIDGVKDDSSSDLFNV